MGIAPYPDPLPGVPGQVFQTDLTPLGEHRRVLDHVLQLADIAAPLVAAAETAKVLGRKSRAA